MSGPRSGDRETWIFREAINMSYSHTQRRKTIRRFKKQYGKEWYGHFRGFVAELVKKRLGPPIGTLEDILGRNGV